jgi:hypothetical protein
MKYYLVIKLNPWNWIKCIELDGDHSVKRNNPCIERQISQALTHLWNLKQIHYMEDENRMVITGSELE